MYYSNEEQLQMWNERIEQRGVENDASDEIFEINSEWSLTLIKIASSPTALRE